jgi:hypothetical protein
MNESRKERETANVYLLRTGFIGIIIIIIIIILFSSGLAGLAVSDSCHTIRIIVFRTRYTICFA